MNLIARRESEPPSNSVTEKKTILGDPDAELVVLLSQGESGYQVSSVIRILGYRQNSLDMAIDSNLRAKVGYLITGEMQRVGATAYGFLNREEAQQILAGEYFSPLGELLMRQDFSRGIPVRDIKINKWF